MIPKIIHYCWFGGNPLPPLAVECIASWKKFFPDYEIKRWDESNFDVNSIPYTEGAYKQKKYAFVSDYARFWIMYNYGGLYFDTDVEVIRPFDDIIQKGNFMGYEVDPDGENSPLKYAPRYAFGVAVGLGFGMGKGHPLMKRMLDIYTAMPSFQIEPSPWGRTVVSYVSTELVQLGLKCTPGIQKIDDITIYPHDFFAPINVISGRIKITENTRTIHRYMGSWGYSDKSWKQTFKTFIPESIFYIYNKVKRRKYKL